MISGATASPAADVRSRAITTDASGCLGIATQAAPIITAAVGQAARAPRQRMQCGASGCRRPPRASAADRRLGVRCVDDDGARDAVVQPAAAVVE
jgi:hypothetical protein